MNSHAIDGRIAIVVKPLDRTFNVLRFVLIPTFALLVSLPVVQALAGSLANSLGNWFLVIPGALIVAAYVGLLQVDTVRARVDRRFAQVRRQVAMRCNHDETQIKRDRRAACLLTPEIFRAPLFQYEDQFEAVTKLREACEEQGRDRYWFVEGERGSGKTRTVLRLIQALARDRRLFELGNKCYLYDFSESELVQKDLLEKMQTLRHEGAVVFVDNFQLVRDDVLHTLTNRLLERGDDPPEQLLVFLTRPADAWNLRPSSDVRLVAEAKVKGHHIKLAGASPSTVTQFVSEFDKGASELIRDLEDEEVATAAQMQLAQVIAQHKETPAEAGRMLSLLRGEVECSQASELSRTLAALAALSVHRGVFSRRELWQAVRVAGRASSKRGGLLPTLRMHLTFRRLQQIGIVSKMYLGGTRFLFHEGVAELCVDRLFKDPIFREPFAAAGMFRLKEQQVKGDRLTAWLIAAEINAQNSLEEHFDEALGRGAYQRMARCLRRAAKRYQLSPHAHLQLAILLDRIGCFEASRNEFTDDLVAELSRSDHLAVILAASRIESGHDRASEAGLDVLCRHSDPLIRNIGEYWKLHIAGHRGRFDSASMLALASSSLELIQGQETHWLTYSLGRMHFDSLRQHYLEGGMPTAALKCKARQTLDAYLSKKLPIYEGMHILYGRAHLVGHVLLPQLGIFRRPIDVKDITTAQIGSADVVTADALAMKAQRLYQQAREAFWQYGDREAEYLEADILNAEMVQLDADLDRLETRLLAYQQFITDTGFEDIFSYPHFYLFKWCMLKRDQALASSATRGSRTSEDYLEEATWHLQRMTELDEGTGNQYGLLRTQMLTLLLNGLQDPISRSQLLSMGQRMDQAHYGFEARLMQYLAEKPKVNHADLRAVIRYYPFVHQ